NSFDVYLHGTPAGELFKQETRSFSHGCIRVEDPVRLAHAVLQGRAEADTARIRRLIDDGATKTVSLPHPLPGHIVYFTAMADAEGSAGFRDDVYGIDQDLSDRLRGRAAARATLAGRRSTH